MGTALECFGVILVRDAQVSRPSLIKVAGYNYHGSNTCCLNEEFGAGTGCTSVPRIPPVHSQAIAISALHCQEARQVAEYLGGGWPRKSPFIRLYSFACALSRPPARGFASNFAGDCRPSVRCKRLILRALFLRGGERSNGDAACQHLSSRRSSN